MASRGSSRHPIWTLINGLGAIDSGDEFRPHKYVLESRSVSMRGTTAQQRKCAMARKPFNMLPKAFGPAEGDPNVNVTVFTADDAPAPRQGTPPAITRKLEGDGVNLIFLTFTPGQVLRSHTTAHPITVQALQGSLVLTTDDGDIAMAPGTVVHLRAMVAHEVSAPEDAEETNVLLLSMLTGERHSVDTTPGNTK